MSIILFEERFVARAAYGRDSWDEGKRAEAKYIAGVEAAFKATYPKRKKLNHDLANALPAVQALRTEFDAYARAFVADRQERLKALDTELREIARDLEVPVSDDWYHATTSHSSTYSTQGFGANRYAREAAEEYLDDARRHGVEAEVRVVNEHSWSSSGPFRSSGSSVDYGVFVKTTPLGWQILKRKPSLPLREWVRLCWKRGVNPRVFNAFLPADYEERAGLDYFGNDLRLQSA